MMLKKISLLISCSFVVAGSLSGCGGDKDKTAPTQVLARVNGKELTVHQLNFLLQSKPQADNKVKQQALDALVDQELLVQKAEELKLERDPTVLQMIEQSRRQILAQSALQKLAGAGDKLTDAQIADFYTKNPNLFSDRKIYTLDTFAFPKDKLTSGLQSALDPLKTAAETSAVLVQNGITAQTKEMKLPAEQLPMAVLNKAASMQNGDIFIFPEGDQAVLLQLRETVPAPVTQQQADPIIRRYLQNTTRNTSIETSMKTLRTAGKIEYVQKFDEKSPTSKTPTASTASAVPAAPVSGIDQSQLKKGLTGLK